MSRSILAVLVIGLLLTGCTAAHDEGADARLTDTEVARPVDVVVDTDLGGDDLAALAWLLTQPKVTVRAVTVPASGLVTCPVAGTMLGALVDALDVPAPPLACGRTRPGAEATAFPPAWSDRAARPWGTWRLVEPVTEGPAALVARLAGDRPGLQLLALGPLTEVPGLIARTPSLAGITIMGGRLDKTEDEDEGVAEGNAAADPTAFRTVLQADLPIRVVPADVVPAGVPEWLDCWPALGAKVRESGVPAVWDLAAAVLLAGENPDAERSGTWQVSSTGRLSRQGDGAVRVRVEPVMLPTGACPSAR